MRPPRRDSQRGAASLMRSDRQDDSTAAVGLAYQPPRRQPVSIRSALVPRASCEARTTASPPEGPPSTRPPRSGPGATDETRRPQTGSVRGLQGAREDHAQPASGSVRVGGHHPSCVIRATRRAKSRKTNDDGSPCARGCCAPCSGKPIRARCSRYACLPGIRKLMGTNAAASPGSISTSIRSRHAAVDRMRSRTCRTTFLEGG